MKRIFIRHDVTQRVTTKSVIIRSGAAMLAAGLLGLAAGGAAAQSPSLDVTLGFIRDKVAQQGMLAYTSSTNDPATGQTWGNQFTVEASNVAADVGDCSLTFHWHSTVDGKQAQDLDTVIHFKIVTGTSITSMDEDVARLNANGGHAGWRSHMSPPVWVLLIQKSNGHTNTLDFADGSMAERVSKAIKHAAELCGGSSNSPF